MLLLLLLLLQQRLLLLLQRLLLLLQLLCLAIDMHGGFMTLKARPVGQQMCTRHCSHASWRAAIIATG
jgi:hypothetical protein